jgi:exodeoxyribonuclease VII large subunit
MPAADTQETRRDVWTVSRLNAETRAALEGSFPLLWIEGEVSGFSQPRSGHWYFTLKDPFAQVRCAMFRSRNALLRFTPVDGQQVLLRARVSFYEARGEFQLAVEHMEPSGEGALRRAFEELKARLAREGLFDADRKKPLPAHPRRLGVVTSPTGAAIHDVLTVLARRFPGLPVVIYPVPVQGNGAAAAIAAMLRIADARAECDVLLLTRGGGSPEDLAPFNDEALARTIALLRTPIVSAVGHEVDFTIADFVADRRAPTPSAAAELVSPDGAALREAATRLVLRLRQAQARSLALARTRLDHLTHRLGQTHPAAPLRQRAQRIDELDVRLRRALGRRLDGLRARLVRDRDRLALLTPARRLVLLGQRLDALGQRLHAATRERLAARRGLLAAASGALDALSPLATLARGYALVRRADDGRIVRDCASAPPGTRVSTLVADGVLDCLVEQCGPRER